ncbi:hypothetical protein E1B28_005853 [Marasmius oreades]|uniref:Methyltransferase domain-containing protein n=1 Tax=Marasmius oreades TaxID=181124 RepID=A0A9P7S4I9_9AGAR|nr:uncharacterized protein E1B28_005853 [Marasmius oreades]KAG7095063.1 hypothetical protein E1B28_005853 [Marasmius oreades]
MRLTAALSILPELYCAIQVALFPTFRDVWLNPILIFDVFRVFMTHVWVKFADPTNEGGRVVKEGLITPHATGIVLDLGAGHGHTVDFLDRQQVTTYIALEPNGDMHTLLRQRAAAAGYLESDGSLIVLSCSAENIQMILERIGRGTHPVDTIVSVLTMCTIPSPQRTMRRLVRDVLKSGGEFLYYEHVLSPRSDVAWWQKFWAPLWSLFFDGCRMDRPSHLLVEEMRDIDIDGKETSMWREGRSWGKLGESEENLWWHQAGRFVKR